MKTCRHRCARAWIGCILAFALSWSPLALAMESILDYHVLIEVLIDGTVDVNENIRVNGEGDAIR